LASSDAALLDFRYRSRELVAISPVGLLLPVPALLGAGEQQSILLAIEQRAVWLLVDDLDARRAASTNLEAAKVGTRLKGTLGVIVSACEHGHLSKEAAVGLVDSIRLRKDIWISNQLCNRAVQMLQ
jgi:predicted nucleic acid-binding protein